MVLVVSPGHPMAGARQVEVADLRRLRFVSLQKSSTVQGIRNILQGHGVVWSSLPGRHGAPWSSNSPRCVPDTAKWGRPVPSAVYYTPSAGWYLNAAVGAQGLVI